MKSILITIGVLLIFGCDNSNKSNVNIAQIQLQYEDSFYKNNDDTIQFVRFVKDSSGVIKIAGIIAYDPYYSTNQIITENIKIEEHEIKEFEVELLNNGFRNKFDQYKNVMFVQLNPKSGDDFELLDLRHEIEDKIGNKLAENGIGKWMAGDLGPGGANMLFEVTDWDEAFQLVLELLNSEGLLNNCLITKRLYTADDDWNYEIVYPIDYEGIFNSM